MNKIPAEDGNYWEVPDNLDTKNFNFSWRPDPFDPPYVHQFGTQWQRSGGPRFIVLNADGVKYHDSQRAIKLPEPNMFKVLVNFKLEFDFSWHPDESEPPFIWVFGNQFYDGNVMPTVEYAVQGASQQKFVYDLKAKLIPDQKNWYIHDCIDLSAFDFNWHPNPYDPPYIYTWGNKWVPAEVSPTVEYRIPGATEKKFMHNTVEILPLIDRWTIYNEVDKEKFDFTWRPNPYSPPYVYQWENNGPKYAMPGATEVKLMKREKSHNIPKNIIKYFIKTTLDDLIAEHQGEVFWALNPDINYDKFDFDWEPNEENFKHINVFGTTLSKDIQTYYVNGPMVQLGYRELNYVEDVAIDIDTNISMFYIDTGNSDVNVRFTNLKEKYPHIEKTRFVNSWVDTIARCSKKTKTKLFWVLSSDLDYSEFEFDFYPANWQADHVHVFGTQYSHWGNTYLVNSKSFPELSKNIKHVEDLPSINHVNGKYAKTCLCLHDILYIDHGIKDTNKNLDIFQNKSKKVYQTVYKNSYLETIRDWMKNNISNSKPNAYLWVTSSICDYSDFDFSWHPDAFQAKQIHVFTSIFEKSKQKFGDTFLIPINEFIKYSEKIQRLEDYELKINYIENITVPRHAHPVIKHKHDSQVLAIKTFDKSFFPYYAFHTPDSQSKNNHILNLWEQEKTPIIVGSMGASYIVAPHIALSKIKNEVYDYPYIDKAAKMEQSSLLNIVFISNGEPIAEENFKFMSVLMSKQNILNKVIRVKDVNGRVESQHEAAKASSTDWYFLVNGKIRISENFNWSWQPDRLQAPKHYIFHATNPVNGLVYGHQAIVANNKKITLETKKKGLDFTLDGLHEVVDMDCGVAIYNTDPWTTWRTAFREAIKLRCNEDPVSKQRLECWLTVGNGENGEYSIQGAKDGVEYWENVSGNMKKLLKSYDWDWIRDYYQSKYKST